MANDSKALDIPHKVILESRGAVSITGVTEVESFDEEMAVLHTTRGVLVVRGKGLHLQMLNLDGGQVHADGTVDSLTYEDDSASSGGFFARLFG